METRINTIIVLSYPFLVRNENTNDLDLRCRCFAKRRMHSYGLLFND